MNFADKVEWLYLVVAGGIIHLVMDWFAQNNWQATNKMNRRMHERWMRITAMTGDRVENDELVQLADEPGPWWDRDKSAYVHAGLHFLPLLLIFPLWAALIIAVLHLIIDTRSPLDWWGKFTRQTQRSKELPYGSSGPDDPLHPLPQYVDVGMTVGFWRDQTAHIAVIALVALVCVL